jgi:hypothetical protein
VKRSILEKFHIDPKTFKNYILIQIITDSTNNNNNSNNINGISNQNRPNNVSSNSSSIFSSASSSYLSSYDQQQREEIPINDNCNVFYAAKRRGTMSFVLRRRYTNELNNHSNYDPLASTTSNESTLAPTRSETGNSESSHCNNLPPKSPSSLISRVFPNMRKKR